MTCFDGANGSDRLKYSGENVRRTDVCTYMRMDKGREDSESICLIIIRILIDDNEADNRKVVDFEQERIHELYHKI